VAQRRTEYAGSASDQRRTDAVYIGATVEGFARERSLG